MTATILLFYLLLFIAAFLYASVGHGGASGYLAIMALFSVTPEVMKPTALLLNLFVSLTAFIHFYRAGHFKWKLFLPLAVTSIPFSFLGGLIVVDGRLYKRMLGLLLLLPVVRFTFFRHLNNTELKKSHTGASLAIGAVIGLLSGMIGIGGGIILSPVLLLLKWADQKQAAAVSALFIFVNSLSGLIGQASRGIHFTPDMVSYVAFAMAGGLAGAFYGAKRFTQPVLQHTLALVLAIAAWKLLFT